METIKYHALSIGDTFKSKFIITKQLVNDYVEALDDNLESNKVPNYLFAIYAPIYQAFGGRLSPETLQIRQKMEHFHDAHIGDEIDVIVTVKNKYKKKERDYFIYEVCFQRANDLVCRYESTHYWDFLK